VHKRIHKKRAHSELISVPNTPNAIEVLEGLSTKRHQIAEIGDGEL